MGVVVEGLEKTRWRRWKQPDGILRAVNWNRIDQKPAEKNFYNTNSAYRKMDQRWVEQFR